MSTQSKQENSDGESKIFSWLFHLTVMALFIACLWALWHLTGAKAIYGASSGNLKDLMEISGRMLLGIMGLTVALQVTVMFVSTIPRGKRLRAAWAAKKAPADSK